MERYIVVSSDGHAGPPAERYRDYLDPGFRERFDEHQEAMSTFRASMQTESSQRFVDRALSGIERVGNRDLDRRCPERPGLSACRYDPLTTDWHVAVAPQVMINVLRISVRCKPSASQGPQPARCPPSPAPCYGMFEEWPGNRLASGLIRTAALLTAIAASPKPTESSRTLPG